MATLTILLTIALFGLLFAVAAYAIFVDDIIDSIVAMWMFSIGMAVLFVLLKAPDVAMAQAVIGAGILTAFFVVTVSKTEGF